MHYIQYYNKDKNFTLTKKTFTGNKSYENAVKWAKKNIENYTPDMVRYTPDLKK